jgi:hypothetical protein
LGSTVASAEIDAVTEVLDQLMAIGMYDIYQATHEKVAHDLSEMEAGTEQVMFDYKVSCYSLRLVAHPLSSNP